MFSRKKPVGFRPLLTGVALGVTLVVLTLVLSSRSHGQELFVKVPYARAVDEVVYAGVKAGTIKPPHPDRVRVRAGKVEMAYGLPGSDATEWKEVEDDGRYTVFATAVFLNDAKYDSDGFYMLSKAAYDQVKDKLVHKHKGRLEYFILPEAKKKLDEEFARTKVVPLTTNLDDFELYVWDETDHCWRFPQTLGRVPQDHKTRAGGGLPAKQPPPPDDLKDKWFGVLDEMLARHEKLARQGREDRAKAALKKDKK